MRPPRVPRRAITLTEMVIVVLLALVVVGLLVTSLPRAGVQNGLTQSQNNLKQMGLAIHNLASLRDTMDLPPTFNGGPGFVTSDQFLAGGSFFFNILPLVEQDALYNANSHNPSSADVRVRTYQAAADPTQKDTRGYTSYGVNNLFFNGEKPPRLSNLFEKKGTSNVVVIAERYAVSGMGRRAGPHFWARENVGYTATEMTGFQLAPTPVGADEALPHGFWDRGMSVLLGDGSVRIVSSRVSPKAWGWANDPKAPAEPAPSDW